jgi:hypothetical protein
MSLPTAGILMSSLTLFLDLQHAAPDVFKSPPSVLEALRMVNKAHPAVIKSP